MLFRDVVKGITFKCDECKKTFKGEEIKLKPASKNVKMTNPMMFFKFVDKYGMIKGGYEGPDASIGDQVACCPHCDYTHLFGFEEVKIDVVITSGKSSDLDLSAEQIDITHQFFEKVIKDKKVVFIDDKKKTHEINDMRLYIEGVNLYGKEIK